MSEGPLAEVILTISSIDPGDRFETEDEDI